MANKVQAAGIKCESGLTLFQLTIPVDSADWFGRLMSQVGQAAINLEFITQTLGTDGLAAINFCVRSDLGDEVAAILAATQAQAGKMTVHRRDKVGLVQAFGPNFRRVPGIAGLMVETLCGVGIQSLAISTSISAITCVVAGDCIAEAEQALKSAFEIPEALSLKLN